MFNDATVVASAERITHTCTLHHCQLICSDILTVINYIKDFFYLFFLKIENYITFQSLKKFLQNT